MLGPESRQHSEMSTKKEIDEWAAIKAEGTEVAFRVKAVGVIYFLICSFTLASTGCMHKMPLDKRVFSLEGPAEFPIMAPSNSPSTLNNDFQEYQLELAGKEAL